MNSDLSKGLEQDAQRITERKPENMSKTTQHNIMLEYAEKLKGFMNDTGTSQSRVAKRLGVSSSVVSQFLKGKYPGDIPTLVNKIVELINSSASRDRNKGAGYVETTVARQIAALIANADAYSTDTEGCIGVVIGDSGHGKSVCLRQYAAANESAYYIQLSATLSTRDIFIDIGRAVGATESGMKAIMAKRIIDRLRDRHAIIILDECSHLNPSELNQLRQTIVDHSGCPLILAGNNDLLKTIESGRSRRGYESLDQFQSRMIKTLNLDDLADGTGGGGLYSEDDVKRLYEYGGIKLTKDAGDTLRRICRISQTGRLRTCARIIAALHTAAAVKSSGKIDGDLILAAITELGLPVGRKISQIKSKQLNDNQAASPLAATA